MSESNLSADTRRSGAHRIDLNSDAVTDSAYTSHYPIATGTGMPAASSLTSDGKTVHIRGDLQDSLASALAGYTHESIAYQAEQFAGRSVSSSDHVAEHGSSGRLRSRTTSTSRREPLKPSSRPVKMGYLQSESLLDAGSEGAGKADRSLVYSISPGFPTNSLYKSIPDRPSPECGGSSVALRSENSRAVTRGVRRRQQRRTEFSASKVKRAHGSPKRCELSPSRIQLGRVGSVLPPYLPWSHTAHVLSAVRGSVSAAADRIVAAIQQLDSDVRSRDQTVEARAARAAVRAAATSTKHKNGNRRAVLRSGGKLMPTRSKAKGNRASRRDKKVRRKGIRKRAIIGSRRAPSGTSVRGQYHDQRWFPPAGPPPVVVSDECTVQLPRSNALGTEARGLGLSGLEVRDAAQREENPQQNHAVVDEPELLDVVLEAGQARPWTRQAPLSPPLRAVQGRLHSSRQAASLAGASAAAAAARALGERQTRRQQVAQLDALVAELRQHSADVKRQMGAAAAYANVEKIRADQAVLRAASSARARADTKAHSSSGREPSQRDRRLAAPRAVRLELSGLAGGSSRALRKRKGKHSRRKVSGRPPQAGGDARDLYLHGIMRPVRCRAAGHLR